MRITGESVSPCATGLTRITTNVTGHRATGQIARDERLVDSDQDEGEPLEHEGDHVPHVRGLNACFRRHDTRRLPPKEETDCHNREHAREAQAIGWNKRRKRRAQRDGAATAIVRIVTRTSPTASSTIDRR